MNRFSYIVHKKRVRKLLFAGLKVIKYSNDTRTRVVSIEVCDLSFLMGRVEITGQTRVHLISFYPLLIQKCGGLVHVLSVDITLDGQNPCTPFTPIPTMAHKYKYI